MDYKKIVFWAITVAIIIVIKLYFKLRRKNK